MKKGTHITEETRLKMSKALIGNKRCIDRIPWNKGLIGWTIDKRAGFQKGHGKFRTHEQYISDGIKVSGENHPSWKGDNVSYRNLHRWVERKLGKAIKCMINPLHKSSRYHWANISHEYKRDLSDWLQMCPSCNCKDRIGRRVSP